MKVLCHFCLKSLRNHSHQYQADGNLLHVQLIQRHPILYSHISYFHVFFVLQWEITKIHNMCSESERHMLLTRCRCLCNSEQCSVLSKATCFDMFRQIRYCFYSIMSRLLITFLGLYSIVYSLSEVPLNQIIYSNLIKTNVIS